MIWLVVALVVVVVAAALLIWILLEARAISAQAERALEAAAQVEANTGALWAIPQVNQLLKEGNAALASIHRRAGDVADAVSAPGAGEGSS